MYLRHVLSVTIFILIASLGVAQTKNNYTAQWKKVDSLINQKGLTASALKEIQSIYNKAKQENNQPQVIKALVYRMNLEERTDRTFESQISNLALIDK
ncbi:MAG TPA: hypothetical protein VEB42_13720, partial [Chitinophagaceae bacterium]|nr:hypothetical protein [Chitinophagaceae bacterium]